MPKLGRLINTSRAFQTSSQQIELAQTVYRQTVLQQQQGTAALADVLPADNALREAQQNYLNANIEYLKAELGLNTAYAAQNLRIAFTGSDDATLTEGDTEYPVRIWLQDLDRRDYRSVSRLNILNPKGFPVQVSQFAEVVQDRSPSLLERKDRQPAVTLAADALGSVLAISFLLIYLILVALYDSYIYPFVALFAIPVAAIGAFLALNLTMSNLSLFALLGLIMLMGLVTKNAILIVDFTNQLKAEGKHFKEALIIAGKERMRPILMTTLSRVIGMLPIALAKGTASEWKNGLAWVIIGGHASGFVQTTCMCGIYSAALREGNAQNLLQRSIDAIEKLPSLPTLNKSDQIRHLFHADTILQAIRHGRQGRLLR
jgi:HAE1 family hydrophobic/amphiphilic exporter-1